MHEYEATKEVNLNYSSVTSAVAIDDAANHPVTSIVKEFVMIFLLKHSFSHTTLEYFV